MSDPAHYATGGRSCTEALRDMLTPAEYRAHQRAAAVEYLWRAPHKGHERADLAKARRCIELALDALDEDGVAPDRAALLPR